MHSATSFSKAKDEALDKARRAVKNQCLNRRVSEGAALEGNCYRSASALMVMGRALNMVEDDDDCSYRSPTEQDRSKGSMLDDVARYWSTPFPSPPCVRGYRYNSSAFWRVTKCIFHGLNLDAKETANWPQHLVWSNLYKFSPSTGGNPPARMQAAQFEACVELLNLEIGYYDPRRLLLITGHKWAEPFLERLKPRLVQPCLTGNVVECAGWLNGGAVELVVTRRPEARDETKFTESVVSAFQQLSRLQVP